MYFFSIVLQNSLINKKCDNIFTDRSKADESESDIAYQFDLDSSFKRILSEKRQMTNKENNPPAIEQSSSSPSTSANPPEKPMRMDLLKERE